MQHCCLKFIFNFLNNSKSLIQWKIINIIINKKPIKTIIYGETQKKEYINQRKKKVINNNKIIT